MDPVTFLRSRHPYRDDSQFDNCQSRRNPDPPSFMTADDKDGIARHVPPTDLAPRPSIKSGWRGIHFRMRMPLANECDGPPTTLPMLHRHPLITGIPPVEEISRSTIALEGLCARNDLDMWAS